MKSRGTPQGRASGRQVRLRSQRLDQINPSLLALAAWMSAKGEIEKNTSPDDSIREFREVPVSGDPPRRAA